MVLEEKGGGEGEEKQLGTYRLTLPGQMLTRGFWLYVWRVTTNDGRVVHYVGRTGDNSSPNASPPYVRMGQHLGSMKNQNALRRNLVARGINPDACRSFDLIAHGPVHPEVVKPNDFDRADKSTRERLMKLHLPLRDEVGAMEKRLAEELAKVGYVVLNTVQWKHKIDDERWRPIREAFLEDFPELRPLA